MDVRMPEMNGLEATRQIHRQNAKISILMVAMTHDEATVRQALEYGAQGYISKDEFLRELVPGVRAVSEGKKYFSPSIAKMLPDQRDGQPPGTKKTL
jgi:DNA-binding NarL/FixJ family response regulator